MRVNKKSFQEERRIRFREEFDERINRIYWGWKHGWCHD